MFSPAVTDQSGWQEVHELKVLALIDHLEMGGAEMLLGQFAAAAPEAGINLSVACLADRSGNPAAAPLLEAGVHPVNLEVPGRPKLSTLRRVRRHIATVGPDIVHTHLGTSDWVGGLAARSLGLPVVCTLHSSVWSGDLETQVKRLMVRACAGRVIAVSEDARRAYGRHHWTSSGQLVAIHNGVDVRPAPGAGEDVRRELGLAPDDLVVGMVSALRPEKGHDVALAAAGLLRERFPQLRLVIIGEGAERERIASSAAELGGAVVMAGARYDVMRCLDAFDVCLHPSHADAFPTTLIEAMAASVPVLATAVGGIPEIISDGETGVLVPAPPQAGVVARVLEELLGDRSRRAELASAARAAYAARFTARPWVERTRALYDELLEASGRAPRGEDANLAQAA